MINALRWIVRTLGLLKRLALRLLLSPSTPIAPVKHQHMVAHVLKKTRGMEFKWFPFLPHHHHNYPESVSSAGRRRADLPAPGFGSCRLTESSSLCDAPRRLTIPTPWTCATLSTGSAGQKGEAVGSGAGRSIGEGK